MTVDLLTNEYLAPILVFYSAQLSKLSYVLSNSAVLPNTNDIDKCMCTRIIRAKVRSALNDRHFIDIYK